ncbi:conserved hypothetical protein [Shewanella halifaxensis HAW-EB4]|uniref:Uncharacterized protein n=1 Tax=Shewanella halifaxensis (strain HAW-EB4) TaxID=458817 RepID=B0TKY7_SHEHH|nr:hypothetical protein [Shewanella halifaxensis]ABZ77189.1 conserved hypothetical protein [Shewanella halifaxensis HAW-EB4]
MKKLFATSTCAIAILSACSNASQVVNNPESDALAIENKQYLNGLADRLTDRWQLTANGLVWDVSDSHEDHIEMSGEQISAIIYYGSDSNGNLSLTRKLVWPMLRTIPNDTHASLIHDFPLSQSPSISLNGELVSQERLQQARIDGRLTLVSQIGEGVELTRTVSVSTTQPVVIEALSFKNTGNAAQILQLGELDYHIDTAKEQGVYGSYLIEATSDKAGTFELEPNDSVTVYLEFKATKTGQNREFDAVKELELRQQYVAGLNNNLQLITPDENINKMFEFAKLRSAESIFRTKGGLMHAPGGGRYYAAIWANDQAEYINPFFPFLGNDVGNESAINSFEHFARFMNEEGKAIPSSIIAEGDDIWNGAGDRGDCAMIAYGASRFALAYGDEDQAKALLPLIDWCIDFSYAKQTDEGVIASDSDELEGRFPAGDVNLSTNMLTYGALVSSSHLNNELGRTAIAVEYQQRATKLAIDIESYFGASVQGFDTYQYYQGNDKLRAWIALPFSFGIFDRKDQTLAAVLSDQLWSVDGIYSEAGNKTFWDRATLYAFRGIFAAQETDTAMRYFKYYSRKRLLGEHVPYAVEAWPEGDQRHLSAESALYARVVTEGIFGIEPTGFKRFDIAPYLPATWDNMCLKHIRAFESNFDVCVSRVEGTEQGFNVTIEQEQGDLQQFSWDGLSPISISL